MEKQSEFQLPAGSRLLENDFTFGVATASFQIEGGRGDRGDCIWDTFCATANKIKDGSNGDTACDHYRRWPEDVELIDSLGVDAYRLSLSWPRLLDEQGRPRSKGIDFYSRLLDRLREKNIKPFVTLYHWDLPQFLEDKGGWLNRDTSYRFADYAEVVSRFLGEKVYSFATLNEPFCSAYLGYEAGIHAPGLVGKQYGKKAAHHLLLGHGLAMQALEANSPQSMNGIVLNFTPCYPASDSDADRHAAEIADQHFNQWYIQPLFEGRYPQIFDSLPEEQLPDIKDGDFAIMQQSLDFLGVNFYTRAIYRSHPEEGFEQLSPPDPKTHIGWEIYPEAFYDLLTDLNRRYSLPPIYITENGAATNDKPENGKVLDEERIDYLKGHLTALHRAIEAGVKVDGYFCWSLMDNFEWAEGYTQRFGLTWVDYETQQRTLKESGHFYREFISQRR